MKNPLPLYTRENWKDFAIAVAGVLAAGGATILLVLADGNRERQIVLALVVAVSAGIGIHSALRLPG